MSTSWGRTSAADVSVWGGDGGLGARAAARGGGAASPPRAHAPRPRPRRPPPPPAPADKILSKFGEGTFGRVLECWDRRRKEYVAVKIVRNVDKYRHAAMIEVGAEAVGDRGAGKGGARRRRGGSMGAAPAP
jgi:hypothetical protein